MKESQKEDMHPLSKSKKRIKFVKDASIVGHCCFVPNVPNALNAAKVQPVGGRLQIFWQTWFHLCANPRLVSILKDSYLI